VGPARLTGGGLARPGTVLKVAMGFFALAAVSGFALVAISGTWWLLAVGAAAIAAAWFYTGGKRPYGYAGLGEASVFLFFGLVATLGTTYVQLGAITLLSAGAAVASGSYACGVLMINNIRDIASDQASGKRTLAVRLGAPRARAVYLLFVLIPYFLLIPMAYMELGSLLALASLPLAALAVRAAFRPRSPKDLVRSLKLTSIGTLLYAALASLGWWAGL
jgi:1,4-dihydroxy-2-naphthoate octaprenyltransferase